jgi:very-short-patch-repair endonuclease
MGARDRSAIDHRWKPTVGAWHDNPIARKDDAERQALLEAYGDRLIRVTWDQAVARPGQTLARIRAAVRRSAARRETLL